MNALSVHNSLSEFKCNPEMVSRMGYEIKTFTGKNGDTMPYRQLIHGEYLPGTFSMMIFFHGAGSVGCDGYLQMRTPALPFYRYVVGHGVKTILLFPQCAQNHQWVDVPWNGEKHFMPETPSRFMTLAMELLEEKIAEFSPDPARIYASGVSMGGFGAWDIVSRMPDTFAGILSICGGADETQAGKLKHLRARLYHGSEDTTVLTKRSANMAAAMKAAGCENIRYFELPHTKHNSWDAAFADDSALDDIFSAVNPLVRENEK